ncbi:hemolysin III family protein [Clostridium sp. CX1]|uniref:Hemolysin III family protein n=1 Tax=Clostridium tanneri TaxID=3037988 RepID=A0ABU4JRQ6_9CLOT|nr:MULTISPECIES: hemolysin III family protein [unclassified Clostridium]MCT8977815.1 hemolysin III family protein [Clostridium sp. CX1]MDW8800830.1 hemolysin III family protein [Clostridium sp. A1-XYC3]
MFHNFREPVSGLTHLFGAFASVIGLIVLVVYSVIQQSTWHIVTFSVFGISLILLYTASSVYHLVSISEKAIAILRRIDHSMIYVLIAGSYTPICLIALRGAWGWSIFGTIWGLTIVGILVKNFWFNAPRWISTAFYIGMGWLVIIAIYPLGKVLPGAGMAWLFAGGISYTIGGVIYATKRPRINFKHFGFHEIFHIFVLLGSFCHYWLMFKYMLYI